MDIPKYKWHSRISIDLHIYINAQHISSAYFISSHTSGCYNDDNRNAHKNGFKMVNIFYFILQDTGLIVLTPLCANCLWRGSKTRFIHWEVLIYTKQFKKVNSPAIPLNKSYYCSEYKNGNSMWAAQLRWLHWERSQCPMNHSVWSKHFT